MSILSHRRDWKLGLGVGGVSKAKNFKQMYEALLKFPEGAGGGGLGKSLLWVEVWIIYATMHYSIYKQ